MFEQEITGVKFRIKDEDQSRRLQEVLFKQEHSWGGGRELLHTNNPFLFACKNDMTLSYASGVGGKFFLQHEYTEHDPETYIAEHTKMDAAQELESTGKTEQSLITGNPWIKNTGGMPIDAMADVDVLFFCGEMDHGYAHDWNWSITAGGSFDYDICKWRFHRPEDAQYYVQPETEKQMLNSAVHSLCAPTTSDNICSVTQPVNAATILTDAAACITQRGAERDKADGERSMLSCVNAFNALTSHALTEEQGWLFMVCLKMARAQGGCFKLDDYIDGAAYFALSGEAAAEENTYGKD